MNGRMNGWSFSPRFSKSPRIFTFVKLFTLEKLCVGWRTLCVCVCIPWAVSAVRYALEHTHTNSISKNQKAFVSAALRIEIFIRRIFCYLSNLNAMCQRKNVDAFENLNHTWLFEVCDFYLTSKDGAKLKVFQKSLKKLVHLLNLFVSDR